MLGGGATYAALRPTDRVGTGPVDSQPSGATEVTGGGPTTVRETTTTTEAELTTAPDLVGLELAEAQDQLPSTVDVEIVDSIQQGAEPGTVVEQSPAAGESLDGKITLTVAQDAVQVYLEEIPPVSGHWSGEGAAAIAGKQYLHSLGAAVGRCSDGRAVEYNLAKGFRQLVAAVAIDDNASDANVKVQLEIFADGRSVFTSPVGYGVATPIDVDLSGVLRLKFQWSPLQGEQCEGGSLVLGEPTLFGLPGEVPTASTTPTG
jgi:serine/threonine-protein kinase